MMTLYKGNFNWAGECFLLYTHASSERQAFSQFCLQLVLKLGYSHYKIRNYFRNTTRFTITVEEKKKGGIRNDN